MEEPNQIVSNTHLPIKGTLYDVFISWYSLPPESRGETGILTQKDFCKYYKLRGIPVDESSLSHWKKRADFQPRVTALRKDWAFGKTGEVIEGILKSAKRGNPHSQELWLKYFLDFRDKQELEITNKVEFSVSDIRFLIQGLPEELKLKYYGFLRDLLTDASAARDAGDLKEGTIIDGLTIDVQGEADNTPPHVPDAKTHEVATRHSTCLCSDMAGRTIGTDAFYHKGAPWWR